GRILRQQDAAHLRLRLTHVGNLHRAVVDEDETVEPNVERLGDRGDVLRFRLPIDLRGGNIGAFEYHAVVPVERLPYVGLVVLAQDGEKESLVAPAKEQLLEIRVSRAGKFVADVNAVETVLADHAAPQRVVTVEYDAFLRAAPRRRQNTSDLYAGLMQERVAERLAIKIPLACIERRGMADVALHGVKIDQVHPVDL